MNKTELAAKLAKQTDLTQAKSLEVVDSIFSSADGKGIIAVELDANREVSIAGFGKFETRRRKAREGRKPGHRRGDPDRGQAGRRLSARQGPQGPRRGLGAPP